MVGWELDPVDQQAAVWSVSWVYIGTGRDGGAVDMLWAGKGS